jgi:hypothetical protein
VYGAVLHFEYIVIILGDTFIIAVADGNYGVIKLEEYLLDLSAEVFIQAGGSLVNKQDLGTLCDSPSDGNPLSLSPGQVLAVLGQLLFDAALLLVDYIVKTADLYGIINLLFVDIFI